MLIYSKDDSNEAAVNLEDFGGLKIVNTRLCYIKPGAPVVVELSTDREQLTNRLKDVLESRREGNVDYDATQEIGYWRPKRAKPGPKPKEE